MNNQTANPMKPTGYIFTTIGNQTERTPVLGVVLLDAPYLLIDHVGHELADKLIRQVFSMLSLGMGAQFGDVRFSYQNAI